MQVADLRPLCCDVGARRIRYEGAHVALDERIGRGLRRYRDAIKQQMTDHVRMTHGTGRGDVRARVERVYGGTTQAECAQRCRECVGKVRDFGARRRGQRIGVTVTRCVEREHCELVAELLQ